MKVIGFRKSSFKGDDGQTVSGVNLFLTEKCEKGEGQSCDRVYITDQRLTACGYTPKIGDEVMPLLRSASAIARFFEDSCSSSPGRQLSSFC